MTFHLVEGPRDGDMVYVANVQIMRELGGKWTAIGMHADDVNELIKLKNQGYPVEGDTYGEDLLVIYQGVAKP